ncbi:TonB-dependent hemoglobin/transferrin/lactoferrin family receptor [Phyllobacterium leguminum]|uniref:Hemoglobin/transferrin/lactoferrin receptor protein n=1 Tax=Phyllobacterium leguminum TaxID=314237 RepID=A0A318SZI6_9HYPH|nr:TonB-dependent hemoglobin/transferrin/lactoferrin family receptor [Phyllobacterium leguminum]PYE86874.1 hemoglobin/transferrin/lactoferrin receptor protein [Phyllobacterium leguminum]
MHKLSKSFWLGCVAFGALNASMLSSAFAQDAGGQGPIELKPIVVDGKAKKTAIDAPTVLTERVTAKQMQERQVDRIDDIGRLDPGINYNRTSDSINIRGLGDNRVLTTVDGIRIPWLDDGARGVKGGMSTVDFDTLSTLDIIQGADSSLFGSGALGGVIALRTLNPEDLLTEGKNWGSITKGSYDSSDRSWNINQAFAARANNTYVLFQGGYRAGKERENMGDIGGFGATRTEKNPAEYDQNNLLFKLNQHVDGGHRFGIAAERFSADEDIDTLNASTSTYQPGSSFETKTRKRERISATYDYDGTGDAWLDQANLTIYWQKEELKDNTDAIRLRDPRSFIIPRDPFFYGYPYGVYKRDNLIEETSYGVTGNAVKELELGGVNHEFRFGGELYWQGIHQYSAGVDNCPDVDWNKIRDPFGPQSCRMLHSNSSDMPDVDSVALGLYVEDSIKFMDDRLTITPGLRFDWYDRDPQKTSDYEQSPNYAQWGYPEGSSDSKFSPKLRAEWAATDNVTLYAQWAQAFRAPSATELYLTYGNPGAYLQIGNADLEPETSNGFDIGAKFGDDQFGGSVSIYNNYYKNFIDTAAVNPAEYGVPAGMYPMGITRYINRAHVQIYGVEAKAHYAFGNGWKTWGGIAAAQGKDTDEDEYLNSIPALKGVVGLGYATETWGTDVALTAVSKRDKVEDDNDFYKTPGYATVDVTGWWEPEQFKGLRVQAGVYNLFDKQYWNAIDLPEGRVTSPKDYFSEPGRTFKVSLTQRF